jgi:tRNA-specific 2-thiouridylase
VCFEYALRLGAERFATGHYARIDAVSEPARLLRGADAAKDQSYFLHAVGAAELARSLFPVGSLAKPEVRRIARDHGLPVSGKKDSTGICFIGERPFRRFLENYLPAQPGRIESPEGELLGEHQGLMFYTLGQRAGLGLGGMRGHAESPWYVAAKDLERNVLVAVQGHDHPLLMSTRLETAPVAWVAGHPPAGSFDCTAKVRYRQADVPCHVEAATDGTSVVSFGSPQRAVTPGQYAVFYEGDCCLGGGVIEAVS